MLVLGYSLKLLSPSNEEGAYPYKGEWISREILITSDWLCVSLALSVPETFHVSVDLLTNSSTKTVYTVDNIVDETHATDMLTTFEVKVDATQNSQSQLVVYASQGTVIRNVDIQYEHCNSTSESFELCRQR